MSFHIILNNSKLAMYSIHKRKLIPQTHCPNKETTTLVSTGNFPVRWPGTSNLRALVKLPKVSSQKRQPKTIPANMHTWWFRRRLFTHVLQLKPQRLIGPTYNRCRKIWNIYTRRFFYWSQTRRTRLMWIIILQIH